MNAINELKKCPFCGGKAEVICIGNNFTKKRSAQIKCTYCKSRGAEVGAIRNDIEWCIKTASLKWNERTLSGVPLPEDYVPIKSVLFSHSVEQIEADFGLLNLLSITSKMGVLSNHYLAKKEELIKKYNLCNKK